MERTRLQKINIILLIELKKVPGGGRNIYEPVASIKVVDLFQHVLPKGATAR